MDGKICEHNGVTFIFLILTISGGFKLVLTENKPLDRDPTHPVGYNVVIECRSKSMNSTNVEPSWFKYDHGKIVIYNASSSSNSNSSKYLVGTGNKTLTVMNAQWSDALTYCCNVGGVDDYCANVVVTSSMEASVKPSDAQVGDNVTVICHLNYNAPTSDLDAPFPLSEFQDPRVSMFIGSDDIFEEPVVDVVSVPHTKSITINKTLEVADLDRYLGCSGPYLGALIEVAPMSLILKYPNNESSRRSVYSVNEAFECFSERFPFLNVTWTDMTISRTPHVISTGIGNATAKVLAPGYYFWVCSVASPLNTRYVSTHVSFRASAGVITRSILLMAGCMLFISFIIF